LRNNRFPVAEGADPGGRAGPLQCDPPWQRQPRALTVDPRCSAPEVMPSRQGSDRGPPPLREVRVGMVKACPGIDQGGPSA
jgi:hypothetical protein